MTSREVDVITETDATTRYVQGTSRGGTPLTLNVRDSMVSEVQFGVPRGKEVTVTIAAADFVKLDATTAVFYLGPHIPEGSIILGCSVNVGTAFDEDTSADMSVGDSRTPLRYHTTPFDLTSVTEQVGDEIIGSQYQDTADNAVVRVETPTNVDAMIAGAGSMTLSVFLVQTYTWWCLDSTQFKNHELFLPKRLGTCVAENPLVIKLTHIEAEQIAAWIDYFFAVQEFMQALTPTSPLTVDSKYVLPEVAFDLEPYTLTKLVYIVDGYSLGYSLSDPHYTISADDYQWCSKGLDAMDYAQSLIRSKF